HTYHSCYMRVLVILTPVINPTPFSFFFFNAPSPTEIYTLSLHDALPICRRTPSSTLPCACSRNDGGRSDCPFQAADTACPWGRRSEEHTSELQSRSDLVCRLLLEKKKKK